MEFEIKADLQDLIRLRQELNATKEKLVEMDEAADSKAFAKLEQTAIGLASDIAALEEKIAGASDSLEAKLNTSLNEANSNLSKASERFLSLGEACLASKTKMEAAQVKVEELTRAYNELSSDKSADPKSLNDLVKSLGEAKKECTSLSKEYWANVDAQERQRSEVLKADIALQKLKGTVSDLNKTMQGNTAETEAKALTASDVADMVQEKMRDAASGVAKLSAVVAGGMGLKSFIDQCVSARSQLQGMQKSLETMVGKETMQSIFDQLFVIAKRSPLEMTDMVAAEQMMISFGIDAQKSIKYLEALSDVSMGNSGKFNSLTLAFSQMSATGKLMGQDLNQMINQGFNPLEIIATKTGKSIAQLKDEMSQGKITAEMVQQAFIDATSVGGRFHNMSAAASKTIAGQMSMLQDALTSMYSTIGEKLEPVVLESYKMATALVEQWEKLAPYIIAGAASLGIAKLAIAAHSAALAVNAQASGANAAATVANTAVKTSNTAATSANAAAQGLNAKMLLQGIKALWASSAAQKALNVAMAACPYVLVASAVAVIAGAVYNWATSMTAAEESQQRLTDAMAEADEEAEKEKQKVLELATTMETLDKATSSYALTKGQLVEEARKYNDEIANEIEKNGVTAESYAALTQAIQDHYREKAFLRWKDAEEEQRQTLIQEKLSKYREAFQEWVMDAEDEKERLERSATASKSLRNIATAFQSKGETQKEVWGAIGVETIKALQGTRSTGITKEYITSQLIDDTEELAELNKSLNDDRLNAAAFGVDIEKVKKRQEDEAAAKKAEAAKKAADAEAKTALDNANKAKAEAEQAEKDAQKAVSKGDQKAANEEVKKAKDAASKNREAAKKAKEEEGKAKAEYEKARKAADEVAGKSDADMNAYRHGEAIKKREEAEARLRKAEDARMEAENRNDTKENIKRLKEEEKAAKAAVADAKKAEQEAEDKVYKAPSIVVDDEEKKKRVREAETAKAIYDSRKESAKKLNDLAEETAAIAARTSEKASKKSKEAAKDRKAEAEKLAKDIAAIMEDAERQANKSEADTLKKKQSEIEAAYAKQRKTIEEEEKRVAEARKSGSIDEKTARRYEADLSRAKILSFDNQDKEVLKLYEDALKESNGKMSLEHEKYEKQRLAISKSYAEQRARLKEIMESDGADSAQRAQAEDLLDKTDSSERAELARVDFDEFRSSEQYTTVFQDLNNLGKTTILSLKEQMERFGNAIRQSLNPSDAKAFEQAMEQLNNRIIELDPLEGLSASYDALSVAMERKKTAADDLISAQTELRAIDDAIAGENKKSIKDTAKITNLQQRRASASQKVADSTAELAKAENDERKASVNIAKSKEVLIGKLKDLADAAKAVGEQFGEEVGGVFDFISATVSLVDVSATGMQKTSETASKAMQAVERATVILAIIQAAMKVIQALSKFFERDSKAEKAYKKAVAKQQEINALSDSVDNYQKSVLAAKRAEQSWFSSTGMSAIKDSWETASDALDSYYKKANQEQIKYRDEQGKRGGFAKFLRAAASFGATVSTDLHEGDLTDEEKEENKKGVFRGWVRQPKKVAAVDNLRFETQSAKKGSLFHRGRDQKTVDLRTWAKETYGSDLFDKDGMIDVEMGKEIIESYGDKLVGETKATLEALIENAEAYNQAMDEMKQSIASMFSPVVDSLNDAIWNWVDTGEDALKTFKESAAATFKSIAQDMTKTMMNKMLFSQYDEKLSELTEKYAKGDMTEEDFFKASMDLTDSTIKSSETAIEATKQMAQKLQDYAAEKGYDMNADSEVTAAGGGFETMSESTATELSGRFTALYESNLRVESSIAGLHSMLTPSGFLFPVTSSLASITASGFSNLIAQTQAELGAVSGISETLAQSYLVLIEISETAGKQEKHLAVIHKEITEIRKVTDTL